MDSDQIKELIESYEREVKTIKTDAMQLSWYMRGGLTYDDALTLSQEERTIVNQLVKDNLETTKKSGLPFF